MIDLLTQIGFGNIMSKDFIRFKTFKQILGITAKPSIQDLVGFLFCDRLSNAKPKLLTLCAADEMKDITLRAGEKKVGALLRVKVTPNISLASQRHQSSSGYTLPAC